MRTLALFRFLCFILEQAVDDGGSLIVHAFREMQVVFHRHLQILVPESLLQILRRDVLFRQHRRMGIPERMEIEAFICLPARRWQPSTSGSIPSNG